MSRNVVNMSWDVVNKFVLPVERLGVQQLVVSR